MNKCRQLIPTRLPKQVELKWSTQANLNSKLKDRIDRHISSLKNTQWKDMSHMTMSKN